MQEELFADGEWWWPASGHSQKVKQGNESSLGNYVPEEICFTAGIRYSPMTYLLVTFVST